MRHRLLNLSLLVASILFIELLLRWFDPIGAVHFDEVRKYRNSLVFQESYGYLHRPGYRARVQGVDIVINQHGLRSPEAPLAKPAGTRRVLTLGDSVVLGWGAPQDSIFSARLDRDLDRPGAPVEVIAAGVASWNTRSEYEWLRARGVAFDPDVVMLLIVGNDVEPKDVGHSDVPLDSLLAPPTPGRTLWRFLQGAWQDGYVHSRILAHFQYARVFIRQQQKESAGYASESPQWRDARLALDGIADLCAARDIALVVFLYGDEGRVEQSGVLRAYREHLASRGMRTHALPRILFDDRRYHNSIVDGHENAAGHALLARAIGDVVAPLVAGPD